MSITSVETFLLVHRLSETRGPSCAWYDSRESVLVKIADSDGVAGWGETALRPGVIGAIEGLSTLLIGEDPLRERKLWSALALASVDGWAIGALSIALDDLRARRLGVPVSALYGGARRDRVRVYASSGGYYQGLDPEQTWPEETARFVEEGFTAMKLRIGRYAPSRELPLLERIRADVPAEVELIADGNGAYTLPRAIDVARALGRLRFRWFEEPLPRMGNGVSYPGYEELAAAVDIPIAAAEGLESRGAFAEFIRRGGADIVQPDVSICGGIGEARFVAELAALRARTCIPHAWGGAVLLAATLQLLAVLPDPAEVPGADAPLLEYDTFENPMLSELAAEPIRVEDGWTQVPDGPGLGIEVDEEFVARMAVRGAEQPAGARR